MNSENFLNHPVFEKISTIDELLNSEESTSKIDIEKLTFFKDVISFTSQRINLTNSNLVQETDLDSISTELQNANSSLSSFNSSSNIVNLNNATSYLTTVLNKAKSLPIIVNDRSFNFSRKVAEFEKTAIEKLEILDNKNLELENKISELNTSIEEKEAEIKSLNSLLEGKESEIENLTSTFETNFNNLKSTNLQEFENNKNTFRKEIDDSKFEFRNEIDELKDTFKKGADETITILESKLKEAKKIVNVIGNVGVTGNYQNIANQNKSNANLWRWIAIGIMATFSGLLIWTIIDLSKSDFDWHKSILRIIAAAALTYPATYAARESSRHRRLETLNRTAELELASVDTFIEMLDESKKQEIKAKLVEKYFGNSNQNIFDLENKSDEEQLSISSFEKILNIVSKAIK